MYLEHEDDILKLESDEAHLTNNQVFFPELVWELVLEKICAPDDIESCSNASPYFWKFLEKKRQRKVVLAPVILTLSSFFAKFKNDSSNNDESDTENGRLSMKQFWKLREVCKNWNTVIEHLHQSPDVGHFRMRDEMETYENAHLMPWATEIFDRDLLPHQFMDHFEPTHYDPVEEKSTKNPFLGRSVSFYEILVGIDAQLEDEIYLDGIEEILEKFGTEIWYAFFEFTDKHETNHVEIYEAFVTFLKLMPNLKALRVKTKRQNLNLATDTYFVQAMVMNLLGDEIRENPIPTLPNLEFLWTTNLPTEMFDEVLQKNRHVRKLQVDRKECHSDYALFQMHLPNLTALGVTFCSLADLEKFEKYEFRLKLEKFYFWYYKPVDKLSWSRLFFALGNKLGKSCVELLIQMPLPETEAESLQTFNDTHLGRLYLPNLEKIGIDCDSAISLDFLLPAKQSLMTISMRNLNGDEDGFLLKRFDEYTRRQQVQFIGFKERMEDSNIWVEFPMLVDLTLFRKREMGGNIFYLHKCNTMGNCILEKDRWYSERI